MRRTVKVLCLAALMIGSAGMANAQFRQSVFLNLGLPTGGFASSISTDRIYAQPGHTVPLGYTEIAKEARFGFGAGYRASYRFDVGVGMVAPFAQVDILWNTISSDISEQYDKARATSTPYYLNLPLQVGVAYLYDELWNDITPYVEFGLGADILLIGAEGECSWTSEVTGITEKSIKYAYKPSTAMAFSLGIGSYFGEHVSAGLYYYGMGKHMINYTQKTLDNLTLPDKIKFDANPENRSVGTVALRIGFHF